MILALLLGAQLTRLPQLVDAPPAVYPPERLARGETADVACSLDIDESGKVTAVAVEKPVAPDFDAAAVEAIRRFHFSPAEIDGKPAPVRIRYVYHFVIRERRCRRRPSPALPSTAKWWRRATACWWRAPRSSTTPELPRPPTPRAGRAEDGAGPRKLTRGRARIREPGDPGGGGRERRGRGAPRVAPPDLGGRLAGHRARREAARGADPPHAHARRAGQRSRQPQRSHPRGAEPARAGALAFPRRSAPGARLAAARHRHLSGRAPHPQLYHFLGGPSVINEQLLDRIDFYPGGYGAVYGRNLTGAIDVATRKGDPQGLHGWGSPGSAAGGGISSRGPSTRARSSPSPPGAATSISSCPSSSRRPRTAASPASSPSTGTIKPASTTSSRTETTWACSSSAATTSSPWCRRADGARCLSRSIPISPSIGWWASTGTRSPTRCRSASRRRWVGRGRPLRAKGWERADSPIHSPPT